MNRRNIFHLACCAVAASAMEVCGLKPITKAEVVLTETQGPTLKYKVRYGPGPGEFSIDIDPATPSGIYRMDFSALSRVGFPTLGMT